MNEWRPVRNLYGPPMWEEMTYLVLDLLTAPDGARIGDLVRLTRPLPFVPIKFE